MSTVNTYTEEQTAFLLHNAPKLQYSILTKLFNEKFNETKTQKQIRKWCYYHNITAMSSRDLTNEQVEFIKEHYSNTTRKELTDLFNKKFGTSYTVSSIKTWCNKRGLHSFQTGKFEVGNCSWQKGLHGSEYWKHFSKETKKKVIKHLKDKSQKYKNGDIVIRHGSPYVYTKRASGRGFDVNLNAASVVVWESYYGKIPKNYIILHLDGNVLNYNISNLILFPRKCLSNLRHLGGLTDNTELNKVKLKYCELMEEINNG